MSFFGKLFKRRKKIGKEIRILGIDDSPFKKNSGHRQVLVLGTVFRGGKVLDGVVSTRVEIDGGDSTKKIIEVINNSKHKSQLQVIMTDGIALGGFNVIDINKLAHRTKLPVIVVMRKYPNLERVFKALRNVQNYQYKEKLIREAGEIYEVDHGKKKGKIYIQVAGIVPDEASEIVKIATTNGLMPEPIRVSHLMASGVIEGESRGRA